MKCYVSRAALIFARTHAAPPRRLHFAHSSSVIRTGRARISSPVFAKGLRPWPRPAPPRLGAEVGMDALPQMLNVQVQVAAQLCQALIGRAKRIAIYRHILLPVIPPFLCVLHLFGCHLTSPSCRFIVILLYLHNQTLSSCFCIYAKNITRRSTRTLAMKPPAPVSYALGTKSAGLKYLISPNASFIPCDHSHFTTIAVVVFSPSFGRSTFTAFAQQYLGLSLCL